MAEHSEERRRATYEDVLAAPEHVVAEIVNGELVLSPLLGARGAYAKTRLNGQLDSYHGAGGAGGLGDGPGGWWILFGPDLHFDAVDDLTIVVPDIAGWRRERLPELPGEAYFTLAPDWVCEVTSPSNASHDRVRKSAIYAKAGVGHMWFVDPLRKSLEIYRLTRTEEGTDRWLFVAAHEGDEEVRAEPFTALPLSLKRLWT